MLSLSRLVSFAIQDGDAQHHIESSITHKCDGIYYIEVNLNGSRPRIVTKLLLELFTWILINLSNTEIKRAILLRLKTTAQGYCRRYTAVPPQQGGTR